MDERKQGTTAVLEMSASYSVSVVRVLFTWSLKNIPSVVEDTCMAILKLTIAMMAVEKGTDV